jgi:hypothetical protein
VTRLLAALRSLVHATGVTFLWGWLELGMCRYDAGPLPAPWRAVGVVLMTAGGADYVACRACVRRWIPTTSKGHAQA